MGGEGVGGRGAGVGAKREGGEGKRGIGLGARRGGVDVRVEGRSKGAVVTGPVSRVKVDAVIFRAGGSSDAAPV